MIDKRMNENEWLLRLRIDKGMLVHVSPLHVPALILEDKAYQLELQQVMLLTTSRIILIDSRQITSIIEY
jgi:hypothetical protein